jgi:hypothetical protein
MATEDIKKEDPGDDIYRGRTPWSTGWVAAAVIVFVFGYTFVRIYYAREEPPSFPFEESQQASLGPLHATPPWRPVQVVTTTSDTAAPPPQLLNYLPMASGVPREFSAVLPRDSVWPTVVEEAAIVRSEGEFHLHLTLSWPNNSTPPTGWIAFSRAAVTGEGAARSSLLGRIREDLERSIFISDHILILPDPASRPVASADAPRRVVLTISQDSIPGPATRLIIPTRRGLAFLDLRAVP